MDEIPIPPNQNVKEKHIRELLENLGNEFSEVFKLYCFLRVLLKDEYSLSMGKNQLFWMPTIDSLRFTFLSKLYKLYDNANGVFSLRTFLEKNVKIWDDLQMFKYKPNENGEVTYKADLKWVVGEDNKALKEIKILRDKYISHNNFHAMLGYEYIEGQPKLIDCEELIVRGAKIFERYAGNIHWDLEDINSDALQAHYMKNFSEILEDLNKVCPGSVYPR